MFRKETEQQPRTRGQQFREEMNESVNHAMRAAGHAAGGARSARTQMAPRMQQARVMASQRWAAFNEAAATAAEQQRGRRNHRRRRGGSRHRMSRMGGIAMSGALLGMAVAVAMRRRRQQWEEYDPTRVAESLGGQGTTDEMGRGDRMSGDEPAGGTTPPPMGGSSGPEGTAMSDERPSGSDETRSAAY